MLILVELNHSNRIGRVFCPFPIYVTRYLHNFFIMDFNLNKFD